MNIRRALLALGAVVSVATMLGIPAHATFGARVTADEPQYLLSALSLGEDADLDIADEIADRRHLSFHRANLDPQTVAGDGQQLSPHDPGLPALLALPMRVGGWAAAKAVLALCAGVLAALTAWMAIRRFAVAPAWAIATVGVFALSTPLGVYATQVYPELPAALVTMAVVAALTAPLTPGRPTTRLVAVTVVGVALLPWLSVKYVPVAAALVTVALWRLRAAPRAAVTILAVLVVQGAVYLVAHRLIYGGWTVYAAGDHFVQTGEFSVVGVDPDYVGRSRRLIGLLVDREFGLAAWMPLWLLVAPALGALARLRPAGWLALAGPAVAGWLVATYVALTMHGWWWPGRQVVVIVPLLVTVLAWWLPRVRGARVVLVIGGALGVGSWIWTEVEAITRRHTLVVDFMDTANPWYRLWRHALPDGRNGGPGDDVLTVLWVVAVLAAAVAGWRTAHPERAIMREDPGHADHERVQPRRDADHRHGPDRRVLPRRVRG